MLKIFNNVRAPSKTDLLVSFSIEDIAKKTFHEKAFSTLHMACRKKFSSQKFSFFALN